MNCLNYHEFDITSEICRCGKENRHVRCRCEKCGQEHWLPRRPTTPVRDETIQECQLLPSSRQLVSVPRRHFGSVDLPLKSRSSDP